MIDNPEKTSRLFMEMKASLPIEARLSPDLIRASSKNSPNLIPTRCRVVSIFYAGDEGGIACGLDIGGPNTGGAHVSITHLSFDWRAPLSGQIAAYQRHRIKKLKQLDRKRHLVRPT